MNRTVVALRRSTDESALKAAAFDRLPLAAALVNAAGQILAVNEMLAALAMRRADELVGRTVFDLAQAAKREMLARRWARLWQRLQPAGRVQGPLRWRRTDGAVLTLCIAAELVPVADDRLGLLTLQDVTREREARRHRRLDAARACALAAAESAGFLLGADRRVLAYNAAAARLRRDPSLQFEGLPFDYLLDEDTAAGFRRAFDLVCANAGAQAQVELRLRAQVDAGKRPLHCTLSRPAATTGAAAVVAVLRDFGSLPLPADSAATAQARRLDLRERLLQLAIEPQREFAPALSRLLRAAAEALGVDAAGFWLQEAGSASLRCESMFVLPQNRFAIDWVGVEFPAPPARGYLARLRERRPLAIDDVAADADLAALAAERRWNRWRAMLGAPVLIDGAPRGVLSLHDVAPRRWDADEIDFAATAALMIALAMEAAQRQQAESRIERLAWYDTLTGLPNRNLLREMLRDLVSGAADRGRRIALMLIDLDRFKDVNDTLGHLVGDSLIRSAAQILREMVGSRGMVGRLGGDEFVVVLADFEHRQEVARFAARAVQALHRTDLVPNIDTQVSASIGVALFPEHGRDMSTLMKNADSAMYQAKRDGRNQFSFFNPIRHEHAAREVQLGIQLLKALHGGAAQFFVEYQPLVQMASGRVVGLEALIRWQHPTYGRLTPERFIGIAEASGLSERITRWLLGEVCAQILRWRARQPGFDIPVSVNIAGRELGSAALPSIIRSALRQHGIEPSMITLEITERTLVRQSEINNDVMAELASIGIGLVLDDFGTGYSMLGYLKRMPIQSLKLDGSFVEGVPGDADSCAIVHAVLAVARHFRLQVIAEGIETATQVEYLRTVGCEYAQGYYYSRPLMPQTILDYIELGVPAPGAPAAN
jgi:diguanylate cyclase (GGDEF)-like protein/PAS domain S-box-containing protein